MNRAMTVTELYALLDEQRATAAPSGPRRHSLPSATIWVGDGFRTETWQPWLAEGSDLSGFVSWPHRDPAGAPAGDRLGSAVAEAVWAWTDPAAAPGQRGHQFPMPGRGGDAGLVAPAPIPLPSRLAPSPATPTSVAVPGRDPRAPSAMPVASPAPLVPARTELRMPPHLLRAMSEAAAASGRAESEVWAEAAREWLLRHTRDDDPQPPDPAASAPRPSLEPPSRGRCWSAIDILLGDLRAPTPLCPRAPWPARADPAA